MGSQLHGFMGFTHAPRMRLCTDAPMPLPPVDW